MHGFVQDLRFALHLFRKNPGFTFAAMLTLALGIGCNVGVFSFVYAWILAPSPFPDSERIVLIRFEDRLEHWVDDLSPADFRDLREATASTFVSVAAFRLTGFNLSGAGITPERVQGAQVSPGFFKVFQKSPRFGRDFLPDDATGQAHARVAILSDELWKRRYAADPNIIGRDIRLESANYRVIGIMPARFHVPVMGPLSVWVPLVSGPRETHDRADRSLAILSRLRSGVSLSQARASLNAFAHTLEHRFSATHANLGFRVLTYSETVARQSGENGMRVLSCIVACLLLIACTNVANLILARSISRRREIAVRLALGISRYRLIRQLMSESILLFLGGALLSLVLADWMMRGTASRLPESLLGYLPNYGQVHLNYPVLAYTFLVALFTGVLFSLGPALRLTNMDIQEVLRETSRLSVGNQRLGVWRDLLVIGQVAMTLMVSVMAGVLARDLLTIYSSSQNFDTRHVFLGRLSLPAGRYPGEDRVREFFDQLFARASESPETAAVAVAETPPFTGLSERVPFAVEGRPARPNDVRFAFLNPVSPGYVGVLQVRLLQGRGIEEQDRADTPFVAVANQSFVHRYFRRGDAIGSSIRLALGNRPVVRIVGVVEDSVRLESNDEAEPMLLTSYRQFPARDTYLLFRARAAADDSAPRAMLQLTSALDHDLAFERITSLETLMRDQLAPHRLMTIWTAGFAMLALVLSIVGIYAVISYIAAARTQEYGIRMTLGATANDILRQVLIRGIRLLLPGLALGLTGAYLVSFLLRAILWKTSATDSTTLVLVTLLFACCALVACLIPATRASRIEPISALRDE